MLEATQTHIRTIRADALFGKKKHFNAADRKERLANFLAVPVVIINLLISSALFGLIKETIPDWAKWLGAILALVAAICAGIQGYFGLHKAAAGHRSIAARYLALMKICDKQLAFIADDVLDPQVIHSSVEELAGKLASINEDSQGYATNKRDVDLARQGIDSGDEDYTDREKGVR